MRRAALLGACLLCATPAGAQGPKPVVRGHTLDADGAVRVWNLVGAVRVTGWARDSVALVARAPADASLYMGGGHRGVKLGVEERGGASPPADLELRVPRGANLWIKTASAEVTVRGVTGPVEVYAVTGAVRVAGRPSTLRVESLAGPVTVDDGADWLRARTSSGALTVRGAVGDAQLATVGGALTLEGDVRQRATLETVTGPVRQRGTVARGATLAIDTNSGEVTLRPAADAALDLLSVVGRLTSARPAVRAATRAEGKGQGARVAGAGGRVEVRSFKGAIVVE
ncbi:hypothetical protein [Roseisolibacter sp. H3M3-2]|uniref:hypothetical protein n=1 Tax=Roseisolibacter sp. H3M3-2 TaxID=3031323 RepID=UPI0023D9F119|nr:hypothetical protein [Roseisolibacter sp. H3M3-2]MDF1505827.1 hypothetical protein [Roseisolibacter sp. H3M3-2]